MDKPKVTEASVDAEQVVRELVDALKTLQKKPAPLSSSPPGEQEQQKPPESHSGRSKATTLLEALPGVSDLAEPEPKQISDLETAENSQTTAFEVQSGEYGIVQKFCRDHGVVERFRVTPEELKALSGASLLGSLTCEQDVKFMLREIREASRPAEPRATVAPEQIRGSFLLDATSSLERGENHSFGPSGNKSEEREINDHLTREEKDQSQGLGTARNGLSGQVLSGQVASQPEQRKRLKRRTRTITKVAIGISIASLLLWVLTLGILYKLVDAYRRHITTITTLNSIINKQREISQRTISEVQEQAAAAKQASQAVESQADSIKTQADGSKIDADAAKTQADAAALSARSARDMVVIAEAAHVNVDAIYCSPLAALSLDTVLRLRFHNSGRTRADNFESSFFAGIPGAMPAEESTDPATEDPATEVSAASVGADTSISGGTTRTVREMLSKSSDGLTPEQTFRKIVAGKLKFGIWGTVAYTDVLNEKHQENFEYVWDRNFPNACLFTAHPR